MLDIWLVYWIPVSEGMGDAAMSTPGIPPEDCPCGKAQTCYECTHPPSERDKVLDELRVIKEYDRIRFHQKHTLPKSWVEVKVTSVSKDGKRIGISGKMPGSGCTTEMCIDISDVRQVCRWIELRQQAGEQG